MRISREEPTMSPPHKHVHYDRGRHRHLLHKLSKLKEMGEEPLQTMKKRRSTLEHLNQRQDYVCYAFDTGRSLRRSRWDAEIIHGPRTTQLLLHHVPSISWSRNPAATSSSWGALIGGLNASTVSANSSTALTPRCTWDRVFQC